MLCLLLHKKCCYTIGPWSYSTKFCTGKLRSQVQPLPLLYIILAGNGPRLYTFRKKYPFYIFAYWPVLWINHRKRKPYCHFHVVLKLNNTVVKCVCSKYFIQKPLKWLKGIFLPFHITQLVKSLHFYTNSPKKILFSGGASWCGTKILTA